MSDQKKILFISYDGMTDPLGQSQVIPYLQGLSKAGFSIFLLSCEKKPVYEQHKNSIQQLLDAANITWIPLNYTKKPPVVSTLLDIFKLKKAAKKIHHEHKLDMVHTRPGVPALIGLWMKKTMGVKFLNDIREFYADSRVEGGMWNTRIPMYVTIYNYFKKKEAEAVALSDGIVCLTYVAESIIKEWAVYKPGVPLAVIPCSADLQLFDPAVIPGAEKDTFKKELNISSDDVVISYLGSIGGWYLTDEMMQFCKILIAKIPAAKLLFISPHRHDDIRLAAEKYGIPAGKIAVKKATRQQVPVLLSLSDYSVFFIRPCYSKQSSSPTKHGEIMAMGIPLITNSGVGDVENIINRYNSGIVIPEFNEQEFEAATVQVASGKIFDRAGIRNGAIDFYSLDKAVEKYIGIYNSILKQ
ncbi:MAG: glycosyltransferase [Chitinophagaceae bacterium]|nr:glycosyltransferase [Chitinophagaceae bacterium]